MKQKFYNILRYAFYGIIIRPILLIIIGFNVRNADRLKPMGAHLIAANHNSHLDTMVLISLFKLKDLPKIKVVAAKDYFCRNKFMTWFSLNIIGIIPIERSGKMNNPIKPILKALDQNYTVIFFPEGSRGEPESQSPLKYGITKLLEEKPELSVTPIYMHGLGKSLPRGETVLIPFICDVNIGETLQWQGDRTEFIKSLQNSFDVLKEGIEVKPWQ